MRGNPVVASAAVCVVASALLVSVAVAQDGATAKTPAPTAAPTVAPAEDAAADAGAELGKRFTGAFDVSFRPFAGATTLERENASQLARFAREDKKWVLSFDRAELPDPLPLKDYRNDAGQVQAGYLSRTINKLRAADPNADVLRQDPIDLGDLQLGVVAVVTRNKAGGAVLLQQALVRVTDQLYYGLVLTCPIETADANKSPAAREASAVFKAVIDSVERIDLRALRADQEDRIIRSRGLFAQWNKKRVLAGLVPERYLRVRQDGRDVGYAYVVEQPADGLPKAGQPLGPQAAVDPAGATGVLVGVRSRLVENGKTTDLENFMFVTFDRRHEIFSSKAVVTDPAAKREKDKTVWYTELGSSDHQDERVFDRGLKHDDFRDLDRRSKDDPNALPFRLVDRYRLKVTGETASEVGKPVQQDLPPYYLPAALLSLVPRLVPLDTPTGYFFYAYDGVSRKVVAQYVDVGRETEAPVGPVATRAVPVTVRQGHAGAATTYYLTRAGELLGSVNADAKIQVTPTDRATLEALWKDTSFKPGARPEAPPRR
jgi:hypothetical protein